MKPQAILRGKTCLITGASSGIGYYTAEGIAGTGARTVLVCRSREKGERAVEAIRKKTGNEDVELLLADLSSQSAIRALAALIETKYKRLDILVNNAGVINMDRRLTTDGIEETFAVNHLAYYQLTLMLLELLKRSAPARIVNVASTMHRLGKIDFDDLGGEKGYSGLPAYNQSKLANILFTRELARRLEGTGVTVNAVHPGGVASNFGLNNKPFVRFFIKLGAPFLLTPEQGARTSVYVATSPEVEGVTGKYFDKCKEARPSKGAQDDGVAARLWQVSAQMTGVGA